MGGRGYHNDVQGYLNSNGRTSEYSKISEISTDKIDFIVDSVNPNCPVAPEFSNSPNKIYVLMDRNGTGIKSVTVYDENHEQKYSIHLDHPHNKEKGPHVHSGLNSGRQDLAFTNEHQKILDEVYDQYKKWRK